MPVTVLNKPAAVQYAANVLSNISNNCRVMCSIYMAIFCCTNHNTICVVYQCYMRIIVYSTSKTGFSGPADGVIYIYMDVVY